MLLDPGSRTLYVVSSGSQNISAYALGTEALWEEARGFMEKDSTNPAPPTGGPATMVRTSGRPVPGKGVGSSGGMALNPDPVQALPAAVAAHYLTDPAFPEQAADGHARAGALSHNSCFDCHQRSVGAKPFAPVFSSDSSRIYLIHLAGKNLTVLEKRTMNVLRVIPLSLDGDFTPIEAWVDSSEMTALVTFRAEIGQSKPGRIAIVNLRAGEVSTVIPAGIYPWHILPTGSGHTFYVNNFQSSRISVFDLARGAIVDSIVVQNGPAMMLLVPDRNLLLVSCFYTDRILFINTVTHAIERELAVDANPTSMEFSADRRTLYVLCGGESTLLEIETAGWSTTARHHLVSGAYAMQRVALPPL
jgi:DNA-binding beta-propeller fold protein YncE